MGRSARGEDTHLASSYDTPGQTYMRTRLQRAGLVWKPENLHPGR